MHLGVSNSLPDKNDQFRNENNKNLSLGKFEKEKKMAA